MGQVDLDRLEHVSLGQPSHVGVDRGRQEQRLTRGGQLAKDPLDVGSEPDVEHPIGLIEHDVNDVAKIERPALDVVEHSAGRADDQVDPIGKARICRSIGSPPKVPQTATSESRASF